jgi:hypothetical protein
LNLIRLVPAEGEQKEHIHFGRRFPDGRFAFVAFCGGLGPDGTVPGFDVPVYGSLII